MIEIKDRMVWAACHSSRSYMELELIMYPPPDDLNSELSILKALREDLDKTIKAQEVDVAKELAAAEVRKAAGRIAKKHGIELSVTIQ